MKYIKVLTDSNLERIQGGDDLINFYELGEKIGRYLAHPHPNSVTLPMCYEYGPAYPAPVLPCRKVGK